jgi:hypothetical protein
MEGHLVYTGTVNRKKNRKQLKDDGSVYYSRSAAWVGLISLIVRGSIAGERPPVKVSGCGVMYQFQTDTLPLLIIRGDAQRFGIAEFAL